MIDLPTTRIALIAVVGLGLGAIRPCVITGGRGSSRAEWEWGSATAQDGPRSTSAARSAAMRELAQAITLVPAPAGTKSELIPEPIYRWDDPARLFSDGTIWAFGKSGRPDALLCLSLEKDHRGQLKWIHELTSLSSGPVAASSRHASGSWIWNPKEPGIVLQAIPKAVVPADDPGKRLRQMRETARRFKAWESLDPSRNDPSDRFELRLLPQPVLRYQSPKDGLVDGAIFLLVYGRNPEVALLIEARREENGEPAWCYGLARIGAARLHIKLDDREVADLPKPIVAGWRNPYFLFDRPALGLAD
jgi:hypothetical protein